MAHMVAERILAGSTFGAAIHLTAKHFGVTPERVESECELAINQRAWELLTARRAVAR